MSKLLKVFANRESLDHTKVNNFLAIAGQVPNDATVYDTGWQTIAYASGYEKGSAFDAFAYRRIGMIVYLRGGAYRTAGDYTAASAVAPLAAALPVDCRPASAVRTGTFGNGQRSTGVTVAPTGVVQVAPSAGVSGCNWVSTSISFPVE